MREHRGCSRDDGTATGASVLGEEVVGAATRLVDDADGRQAVLGIDDHLDVSDALPSGHPDDHQGTGSDGSDDPVGQAHR